MGTSIAEGVRAASKEATGFLIVPGDMPRLRVQTLRDLAGIGLDPPVQEVDIATCRASWGLTAPTYFHVRFRQRLEGLEGDAGAKSLFPGNGVWHLSVDDAELSDVD
jgi:CTP:molybdopterin cytidylyltransferase MocA